MPFDLTFDSGLIILIAAFDLFLLIRFFQFRRQIKVRGMVPGRLIMLGIVFPADGACSPEDKLKTLIDMDLKNSHTVAERGGQTAPSEVTSHKLWTV